MTFTAKFVAASTGCALFALLAGTSVALADANHGRSDARRGHQHHHHQRHIGKASRVTAIGVAPSRYAARSKAFKKWRHKVADRYGPRYVAWWRARHKDVHCTRGGRHFGPWRNHGKRAFDRRHSHVGLTKCRVSAVPSRGWGGYFGWYRR